MQRFLTWIDDRFPLTKLWEEQWGKYVAPKNFNFWYYFGSLAAFVLVMQIVTGIFLAMNYKPDATKAFESIEYIMRDVLRRLVHPLHALHRRLGVLHRRLPAHVPRVALRQLPQAARAVVDHRLPDLPRADGRGILRLSASLGTDVVLGRAGDREPVLDRARSSAPDLGTWIRGDFTISDVTLNRFFALHVVGGAAGAAAARRGALDGAARGRARTTRTASRSRSSRRTRRPASISTASIRTRTTRSRTWSAWCSSSPSSSIVVFFMPDVGGYFLESNNFIPADPLQDARAHRAGVVLHAVLRDPARGARCSFIPPIAVLGRARDGRFGT